MEPLGKIVLLDSKTNIKKLVGVPSCYFAHVRLRWKQSRKLRLTHTSLSFFFNSPLSGPVLGGSHFFVRTVGSSF
jgi:hypothetical protein